MRTGALKFIAGGWVLLFTDLTVAGADVLPDSVGLLLLFLAVKELCVLDSEGCSAFRILYPVLIALSVGEGIRIWGQISGNLFWTTAVVSAVLEIFFANFFGKNLILLLKSAGFSRKKHWPVWLERALYAGCILNAIGLIFSLPNWIFAAILLAVSGAGCVRILQAEIRLKPFFG